MKEVVYFYSLSEKVKLRSLFLNVYGSHYEFSDATENINRVLMLVYQGT